MFRSWIIGSLGFLVLVLGTVFFLWTRMPDSSTALPTTTPTADYSPVPSAPNSLNSATVLFRAQDVPNAASQFAFTAEIPQEWQAEAIAGVEAISLYDPTLSGKNSLEKSQIFIRYFTAADFLTLSTVTIHSRTPLTISGRPAVRYDISKKPTVADFPNQPQWRNERHIVTDIRVSDRNPSVFYVIAKRPSVSEETFERFLETLSFE